MGYSSDEFDEGLPSLKKLLERHCGSAQAQNGSSAPLELFDLVTPPKASKASRPRNPKNAVGATAKGCSKGTVGGLSEGEGAAKTPVTAIRKPRAALKPKEVKEKVGMTGNRRDKGTLTERTSVPEQPVGTTGKKGITNAFRESSSIASASLDSSDSEGELLGKSRAPPASAKGRRGRKIVFDSDDEFTPDEDSGREIEKVIEQVNIERLQQLSIDLTASSGSEEDLPKRLVVASTRRKEVSSEDEGVKSHDSARSFRSPAEAILSYSPPKSTKPRKILRPTDPVLGPDTVGKEDPAKKKAPIIPPSPYHPTSDLFWDERETNSWIETHSPQKKPTFQRSLFQTSEVMPEETEAPSLAKESKEKRVSKKAFDAKKKSLADEFLKMVDDSIAKGEVGLKCADTGGVQIVWSKTLRTTAGMAKWKLEKLRVPNGQIAIGDGLAEQVRHYATIELSEKVVDSEEKLYNVLCHEWCHLANYMISNIRKPPHGESFKEWAAQCTHAFSHMGVKVTTTHSYQIECKYQWACQNTLCKYIYKRHSQSIDPKKYSCGSCGGGKLLQTHPPPKEKRPITGYQAFMKENFGRIKAENPGTPQRAIMGLVAKEYREAKAAADAAKKGSGFVEAGEKEGVLEELLGGLKV